MKLGFVIATLATITVAHSETQNAQPLATTYRGGFICEKAPGAADILRVPFDLAIRGDEVQFARPLFNLQGTRVIGSELGTGTIDAHGKLHLTSTWTYLGNAAVGDYSGTLTPSGGTLTGTQTWTGPQNTTPVSRACSAALVPAPQFAAAAAPR
jgi:hypothetical protein